MQLDSLKVYNRLTSPQFLGICMTLKAMYNEIADHYDMADRFGSITQSHNIAFEQVKKAQIGMRPQYNVLDLGVGDAAFLAKLNEHLPAATFTGIDISNKMLETAEKKLPLTTIEASAAEANHYLPPHSQDLVIAHFINAYIPIQTLFQEASLLTKANGYFSFVTTTYESFPVAQQYLAEFIAQNTMLGCIIGHYYKAMVKNTTVASNKEELFDAFPAHHFEIVEHQRLHIPITLNTIDDLALFGIEGTWFLNSIAIQMLPKAFLINRMKRLFSKIFTFPYQDTHVIDVILAKK